MCPYEAAAFVTHPSAQAVSGVQLRISVSNLLLHTHDCRAQAGPELLLCQPADVACLQAACVAAQGNKHLTLMPVSVGLLYMQHIRWYWVNCCLFVWLGCYCCC